MTVKELKEFLKECDDDMEVCVEYTGWDIELEKGDCLRVYDCCFTDKRIYLEFREM